MHGYYKFFLGVCAVVGSVMVAVFIWLVVIGINTLTTG